MKFNIIAIPRSGHCCVSFWLNMQNDRETTYLADGKHINADNFGYSVKQTNHSIFITPHSREFIVDTKLREILKKYNDKNILIDCQSKDFSLISSTYTSPLGGHNVIILRDIYNNIASIVRQQKGNLKRLWENAQGYKKAWVSQAKEALGETNYLKDKTVILYNDWLNIDYRKKLCQRMRLQFTDQGRYKVPDNGSYSSFDSNHYQDRAHEMKVLERWKSEINENIYKEILADKEILNLSRRLFNIHPEYFRQYYPWYSKLYYKIYK